MLHSFPACSRWQTALLAGSRTETGPNETWRTSTNVMYGQQPSTQKHPNKCVSHTDILMKTITNMVSICFSTGFTSQFEIKLDIKWHPKTETIHIHNTQVKTIWAAFSPTFRIYMLIFHNSQFYRILQQVSPFLSMTLHASDLRPTSWFKCQHHDNDFDK